MLELTGKHFSCSEYISWQHIGIWPRLHIYDSLPSINEPGIGFEHMQIKFMKAPVMKILQGHSFFLFYNFLYFLPVTLSELGSY